MLGCQHNLRNVCIIIVTHLYICYCKVNSMVLYSIFNALCRNIILIKEIEETITDR